MKKQKNKITFDEEYNVTFNYTNSDGFRVIGESKLISVPVEHGVNEKNNHNVAQQYIENTYKKCEVTRVDYV